MNSRISRHFVTVQNRQIHYRRAGVGPAIILLHQSPTSSRECEPLMLRLLGRHSVFAPDMPGYGASDPLAEGPLTIEVLADRVALFMDALGIGVAGFYGFHTGASIATAFARRHAHRLCVVVTVGLLCPTPSERGALLQNYAPPFLPQWDGSHLAWLWSRVKDQSVFFPWYDPTAAARVNGDGASPAVVQATVRDWLRCSERYGDAYKAAFRYQPERDLAQSVIPHSVVDFAADPLFSHLERVPARPGLQVIRCSTAAEAHDIACAQLTAFPSPGATPDAPQPRPLSDQPWQDYWTVGDTQLRVLRAGSGSARPVLLQHAAQSSISACSDLLRVLGADRPAFALELPGHGESDPLPEAQCSLSGLASLAAAVAKDMGLAEVDLIGIEAGAALQMELALRGDLSVNRLSLISAIDVTGQPTLQQGLLDSYPPSVEADFFGGHLLHAWHMARDHLLYFPWYERRRECAVTSTPRVDAHFLHQAVVDSIRAGASGFALRRAEVMYPLLARLSQLSHKRAPLSALCCAPRWSPRYVPCRSAAAAAGCDFRELPREAGLWPPLLNR